MVTAIRGGSQFGDYVFDFILYSWLAVIQSLIELRQKEVFGVLLPMDVENAMLASRNDSVIGCSAVNGKLESIPTTGFSRLHTRMSFFASLRKETLHCVSLIFSDS